MRRWTGTTSRTAWLLTSIALFAGCEAHDAEPSARQATVRVDSRVTDLDGQPVDPLAADGRIDLLVFVRTDCPISNRYAPELGRIATRFADRPVDLWLVYVDPDEDATRIRRHVADFSLPGTPIRDPSRSLVARAGVKVTPEVAVFDAEGTRRYRGRIDDINADYGKQRVQAEHHELIDALTAVLSGERPAVTEADALGCPIPEPGPAT